MPDFDSCRLPQSNCKVWTVEHVNASAPYTFGVPLCEHAALLFEKGSCGHACREFWQFYSEQV